MALPRNSPAILGSFSRRASRLRKARGSVRSKSSVLLLLPSDSCRMWLSMSGMRGLMIARRCSRGIRLYLMMVSMTCLMNAWGSSTIDSRCLMKASKSTAGSLSWRPTRTCSTILPMSYSVGRRSYRTVTGRAMRALSAAVPSAKIFSSRAWMSIDTDLTIPNSPSISMRRWSGLRTWMMGRRMSASAGISILMAGIRWMIASTSATPSWITLTNSSNTARMKTSGSLMSSRAAVKRCSSASRPPAAKSTA
mmetsp:Transcript_34322/g.85022  ORF Transcript_34322/g.85022 Transcript_34322/m.85022 type:complete len:251 (-) Transcript_34322:2970-3722(-)